MSEFMKNTELIADRLLNNDLVSAQTMEQILLNGFILNN